VATARAPIQACFRFSLQLATLSAVHERLSIVGNMIGSAPGLCDCFAHRTHPALDRQGHSGASLPFGTALPAMITITWMRSRLGKGGAFQTLAKTDLLPLMKKAGMKFFFVAQTVFDGPSSDYAIFTTLASWAVLDGPGPLMSMGEEAYQRYCTKRNALMVSREENVYRFCEDLSYLAGV
jgi:hypothetical protein